MAVIAGTIILIVVFLLIGELRSEISKMASSPAYRLSQEFQRFEEATLDKFEDLFNQISANMSSIDAELTILNQSSNQISGLQNKLDNNQTNLESSFAMRFNTLRTSYESDQLAVEEHVTQEVTSVESNVRQESDLLKTTIVDTIQALHTFASCDSVMNITLPLPSGMYWVSNSTGTTQIYCSTSIAASCNGVAGQWKRLGYLSTIHTPRSPCPPDLQFRSSPPSCRRSLGIHGCSSVLYPSNGMSYSQVCGRVHAQVSGSPDGFQYFGSRSLGVTLDQNYVDGVSLTYGNPRSHIWTFTASVNFAGGVCAVCDRKKPSYVDLFSCELVTRDNPQEFCSPGSSCKQLWDGTNQCVGGGTFYRILSEPTSEDIEMRVCRAQARHDEDILVTFVEIFVL